MQMYAKQKYGQPARFDKYTVSMTHPDAVIALLAGSTAVDAHFTSPPLAQRCNGRHGQRNKEKKPDRSGQGRQRREQTRRQPTRATDREQCADRKHQEEGFRVGDGQIKRRRHEREEAQRPPG